MNRGILSIKRRLGHQSWYNVYLLIILIFNILSPCSPHGIAGQPSMDATCIKSPYQYFLHQTVFSSTRLSAEMLSCCERPSSTVRRSSVNSVLSETVGLNLAKLYGKPQISAIFPDFVNFRFFTTFFRKHGILWELTFQNAFSPTICPRFKPNFMINMLIMAGT